MNLERTLDKRRGQTRVVRRRQIKKVITFQRREAMTTKSSHIFFEKNRVSVAAPGDTPSDATARDLKPLQLYG